MTGVFIQEDLEAMEGLQVTSRLRDWGRRVVGEGIKQTCF